MTNYLNGSLLRIPIALFNLTVGYVAVLCPHACDCITIEDFLYLWPGQHCDLFDFYASNVFYSGL